jgi:RNA polymerase sigma-70 factor (ECF subfamily)
VHSPVGGGYQGEGEQVAVLLCIHVERFAGGPPGREGASFEELYRRWYPEVVNLCRRLLSRAGDPEATAQEAFIRAWMARDRYSNARPFWPWVSTIARRLCLDDRRRFLRSTADVLPAPARVYGPHPEHLFEVGEDIRFVFDAIESLRCAERRALVLRELEGWSYQEIAEFEGVSVEAVRGSLKRARASIRRTLGRERASYLGCDQASRVPLERRSPSGIPPVDDADYFRMEIS